MHGAVIRVYDAAGTVSWMFQKWSYLRSETKSHFRLLRCSGFQHALPKERNDLGKLSLRCAFAAPFPSCSGSIEAARPGFDFFCGATLKAVVHFCDFTVAND